MEFTPEQQIHIDGLVKDAYTRAYTKAAEKGVEEQKTAIATALVEAETKHKASIDTANKQIEDLKAINVKGVQVDNSATEARIAKIEGELKKEKEKGIKGSLESITAKLNAIDPEQAALLIRMQTTTDDNGNLVVINATGQPRNNGDGKPMSLNELCKEFLDASPHFVKASSSTGAGSKGDTGINSGAAKLMKRGAYDDLSPQAQSDYVNSGGKLED